MFCASLRRNSDFATVLPKLMLPSTLGLRENDLATHDIALYIGPKTGSSTRQLRILLFSPSNVSASKLVVTIERIQHLSHLTGGQDIAIIFLIAPPMDTRFASASTLAKPPEDHGTNGMLAYCKLQAELTLHPDLNLPILPLPTLEALPALLQNHLAAISGPLRAQPPIATPFQLLQYCSAEPPLRQQAVFLLSDSFESIKDLAEACCGLLNSVPELSSSSSSEEPISGSGCDESEKEKLKRLRSMVDAKEWESIVVFWQKEWTAE